MKKKESTQETKLCKYCQTEIPKKAKVCPNCRKKQGGKLKWIIIIIVAIVILAALFGGSDDTDTSTSENTTSEAESDGSKELTVGSSLEANDLKVTVDDIDADFTDYDNEYGLYDLEDGMKYIMASFTFENVGDNDVYVDIYEFDCYADDTNCEQQYGLDDSDFINTNLSSGRNVSFNVYFAVPEDAENVELEYTTDIWSDEKAIIPIK